MRADRRRAFLAALLLGMAFAWAVSTAEAFTADAARRLVAELGPQKAAEQVLNDSPTLEAVAAGVAGGSPEWLEVGSQLIGVADSYLKDRLTESFSIALQRHPAAVLALGASGLPIEAVCAYDPFTTAETPPTSRQFDEAIAERERVVGAVRRADLAAAKSACLEGLSTLRDAGARPY
jgi:hypothetical protein